MSDTVQTPFEPPDFGEVVEISDGVLWTRLPFPPPLSHVNVYLFQAADGWHVVDTGIDTPDNRALWERLLAGPLSGRPVTKLLVTHHHLDHMGLAGWFMREHGAELLMTRTAYLMGRMLQLDTQEMPPKELLAFWRSCGMDEKIYQKRASEPPFNTSMAVGDIPLGFTRIKDEQALNLGGRVWTVRTGDGHAPEHATLWSEEMVVGGDQLLPSISPNLGVYATEPLADPVGEWLESCRKFQPFATQDQLVLPGHKRPFYGLPGRLTNLIENHESALERLLEALEQPKTACDCFDVMFRRKIAVGEYGLAMVEAMAHCRYLEHRGLVIGRMREDGALEWQKRG